MSCCKRFSKREALNILYGFAKICKGFIEIHDKYPHIKTQDSRDNSASDLLIYLECIRRIEQGEDPNKVMADGIAEFI
jgi:hypothetical protein